VNGKNILQRTGLSLAIAVLLLTTGCPSPRGMLTGRVYDKDSVLPIEGAQVRIYQEGVLSGYTLTNSSGEYLFNALTNGIYDIQVEAQHYQSAFISGIFIFPGNLTNEDIELTPEIQEGEGEGEYEGEGEGEICHYCRSTENNISIKELLEQTSGDWMLVLLSLFMLALFAFTRKQPL
jgi:hypothetical protein